MALAPGLELTLPAFGGVRREGEPVGAVVAVAVVVAVVVAAVAVVVAAAAWRCFHARLAAAAARCFSFLLPACWLLPGLMPVAACLAAWGAMARAGAAVCLFLCWFREWGTPCGCCVLEPV